jgi:hypothetical protein
MTLSSSRLALKTKAALVAVLGISLMSAACSNSGSGPPVTAEAPLVISKRVWAGYQHYLHLSMPGAFAVSRDGQHAQGVYCDDSLWATAPRPCQDGRISQEARVACGDDCVIFAEGTTIIVPYRVED